MINGADALKLTSIHPLKLTPICLKTELTHLKSYKAGHLLTVYPPQAAKNRLGLFSYNRLKVGLSHGPLPACNNTLWPEPL